MGQRTLLARVTIYYLVTANKKRPCAKCLRAASTWGETQVITKGLDKRSKIFWNLETTRAERATAFPMLHWGRRDDKKPPDSEERFITLERRLKALEVEWMDTLDRLKSMMGRIVKDRARAEAARADSPPDQLSLSDEDVAAGHTSLSQTQEAINQRILARRNRMRSTQ